MLVHSLSCKYALKKVNRRWGEDRRIWKALGIGCTLENDHVFFQNSYYSMYTEHFAYFRAQRQDRLIVRVILSEV